MATASALSHLYLPGTGLSREVDDQGLVELTVEMVGQLVLDVDALPGAGGPDKHQRAAMPDHNLHDVGEPVEG